MELPKIDMKFGGKSKPLKMTKYLPQIIIPSSKNEFFINWYNEDLRFQDIIPHAFERGYLKLENNFFRIDNLDSKFISSIAKNKRVTYRDIENALKEFINMTSDTVVYFEFLGQKLYLELYLQEKLCNSLEIDLNKVKEGIPNPKLDEATLAMFVNQSINFQQMFTYNCFIMLQCALWYMATTTNTKKYKRDNKESIPKYYSEEKTVINVKKNKYITTPIYDMSKIKTVKLDSLIKKRKGWTYSHSFQVHGHYRHYKNGKTIFINSFVKGKGKEEISQIITLNPKN